MLPCLSKLSTARRQLRAVCPHLGGFSKSGRIKAASGLADELVQAAPDHWRVSSTALDIATRSAKTPDYVIGLGERGLSFATQRHELSSANVLLDSIDIRNLVQATLF